MKKDLYIELKRQTADLPLPPGRGLEAQHRPADASFTRRSPRTVVLTSLLPISLTPS